jgi:hypothetical protein
MYDFSFSATIYLDGVLENFSDVIDPNSYPEEDRHMQIMYGRDVNVSYISRQMTLLDILEERLEQIDYVDAVCFDHMSWVECELDTDDSDVAKERLLKVEQEIEDIINEWVKEYGEK